MALKLGIGGGERSLLFYMTLILLRASVILLPLVIIRLRPAADSIVLAWASFVSWLRPPYLYVVLNVVIVTLGVKSGVLTSSGDAETVSENSSHPAPENDHGCSDGLVNAEDHGCSDELVNVEDHGSSDGVVNVEDHGEFICLLKVANGDDNCDKKEEEEEEEKEEQDDEEEALSSEELYEKAEVFICNFYRDLKLQRLEDSWRKMHGVAHTAIC